MELFPEEIFEYTHLDKQTRTIVKQCTSEIKDLMRLTAENIISIGQKLSQVKSQLGHGSFQKWLKSEFEWSEQTARQFMQVYRWSETIENKNFVFSKLGTSALYLLAAPSTPPKAREEILNLVGVGEKVNYTRAKDIINRYREMPLAIDNSATKTVDAEVKLEAPTQFEQSNRLLFRLSSPELGCIVRLYSAEELETITDLSVEAAVKIKIGRWQGRTATIIEVLDDRQLSPSDCPDSSQIAPLSTAPSGLETEIGVCVIDEIDLSDRQKLRDMGRHLIISYGSNCLAIEGNSQKLTAFIEQIKINPIFLQNLFQQAWDEYNTPT